MYLTLLLQSRIGNGIGDIGAKLIAEGLKVNRILLELHLVRMPFRFLCGYAMKRCLTIASSFLNCRMIMTSGTTGLA
jgi:hypothetical protein